MNPVKDEDVKGKSADTETEVESPKDAATDKSTKDNATENTAPAGKKSLGQKEIIPFEWKLIGESAGCFLTLFKAIELEEVEAQMERVRKEGYYKNLKILANTDKIVQSKTGLKVKNELADSKKNSKTTTATKSPKSANPISVIKISMRASVKKNIEAAKKKAKKTKAAAKKKTAKKKTVKKKTTAKKAAKSKTATKKKKTVKKSTAKSKATKKSTSSKKKARVAKKSKTATPAKKTSSKKKKK